MLYERRYDIDWLRVIAIGLLIIYHVAIIFQPWAMWVGFIRSNESIEGLWVPMSMLNVWRIPLLFYVSGMGVYFAIRKRNWRQLLGERAKRILLPYIIGFIAITTLHMYIFQLHNNLPLTYTPHAGHLWFLGNIFIYVLLLAPLFFYLKKNPENRFQKWLSRLMSYPLGPVVVIFLFVAEVLLVKPQVFSLYAETLHGFILGFIAFSLGFMMMDSGIGFWKTVRKWRWLYVILAASLYGVRLFVFDLKSPGYLDAVESNLWIFGVFGFGYRYLNSHSSSLVYLSQAAYPVYIVHMFALYLGAYLFLPMEIPVIFKFIFVVIFTLVFSIIFYEFVIRRIRILRPLFGLKAKSEPGNILAIQEKKQIPKGI